eukprot:Pgem_evm1s13778
MILKPNTVPTFKTSWPRVFYLEGQTFSSQFNANVIKQCNSDNENNTVKTHILSPQLLVIEVEGCIVFDKLYIFKGNDFYESFELIQCDEIDYFSQSSDKETTVVGMDYVFGII